MRALIIGCCMFLATSAWAAGTKDAALMEQYLRYVLLNHVSSQGNAMLANAPESTRAAYGPKLDAWTTSAQQQIRSGLEEQLGGQARDQFELFVDTFTAAEQRRDAAFLEELGAQVGWPGPVTGGFEALRLWGIRQWLATEMEEGVGLLSEIEAAIEPASAPVAVAPPPPHKRPSNPLRAAESEAPPLVESETVSGAPLKSYGGLREERRSKALEQAQAGMAQVAAERDAWEQEYAATIASKAQAEADALKRQAERLAGTDAEALEQRKNSLGAKCVKVLAGVAQASVGAFTGAVGARAADEAVKAIFD